MTRFGMKGARKSVQWTDFSPEPGAPGRRPEVFTKNRDRLLTTDVARKVLGPDERQPSWPVPTTILAGGAGRKTGMPVWRAAPPA